MNITLHEIGKILTGCKLYKHPRYMRFTEFTTPEMGRATSIVWLRDRRYTMAGCVIAKEKMDIEATQVITENPRLAFILLMNAMEQDEHTIHPAAVIDPGAQIGKNVAIGVYSIIEKCYIGDDTVIESGVFIGKGTYIGKKCHIKHGAVIGSDGFGYEKHEGKWLKFPSKGGVYIGDNVHIGANTCIDRGTLGDTVIHSGVKIDNLCHIAHNAEIGEDSLIIANSMIAGSVKIGRDCWVAPSVNVMNGRVILGSSVIGMGSNVLKDIPEGETWVGNPAKKIR